MLISALYLFWYNFRFKFNLWKCRNTKIGANDNKKGISGGEKRRLSFASEVIKGLFIEKII